MNRTLDGNLQFRRHFHGKELELRSFFDLALALA